MDRLCAPLRAEVQRQAQNMPRPFVRGRPAQAPRPDRIRCIERPFGWLPCRLITGGWLEAMSQPAKLLYPLLATAADRRGLSFYGDRRIEQLLALGPTDLARAREELIDADLLAFDGRIYQLLSLPRYAPRCPPEIADPQPPETAQPQQVGPARPALCGQHDSTGPVSAATDRLPDDVQAILDRLLGPR